MNTIFAFITKSHRERSQVKEALQLAEAGRQAQIASARHRGNVAIFEGRLAEVRAARAELAELGAL